MSANIKPKGDNVPGPCAVLHSVSGGVLVVTSSHSDKLPFFHHSLLTASVLTSPLALT